MVVNEKKADERVVKVSHAVAHPPEVAALLREYRRVAKLPKVAE